MAKSRAIVRYANTKKPGTGSSRRWVKAAGNVAATAAGIIVNKYLSSAAQTKSNDDTRTNLNSTFNSTSLYTKTNRKPKRKSVKVLNKIRKKRKFTKSVKEVIRAQAKVNHYNVNSLIGKGFFTVPYTNYGSAQTGQDVFPPTYQNYLMLGTGGAATSTGDIYYPSFQMEDMGHVEDGVAVNDEFKGRHNIKYWFKGTLDFDIRVGNVEYNDANPLYIDVYELTAKRNSDADQSSSYASPLEAWTYGLIQEKINTGDATAALTSPYLKGQIPTQCPEWNKWWRVDQVTRVRFASTAPYHIQLKTSGIFDTRKHLELYNIAGVTRAVMFVVAPIYTDVTPATYSIGIHGINKSFTYKRIDEPNVTPNPLVTWNVSRPTNF